jgi:hypothetical protein
MLGFHGCGKTTEASPKNQAFVNLSFGEWKVRRTVVAAGNCVPAALTSGTHNRRLDCFGVAFFA